MFFSVKKAMTIGGKVYYPCICYEISSALEETVFYLKNKGKAEIYPIKVHFQNGKVIENLDTVTKRKPNKSSKPKSISTPEPLAQKLRFSPEVEDKDKVEVEVEVEDNNL